MSFLPVLASIGGYVVFGFMYYMLDPIVQVVRGVSENDDTKSLLLFLWVAAIVFYSIMNGWWLMRMYREQNYNGGRLY